MATRDLTKEQAAIKTFAQSAGRTPSSPDDWALVHRYAYPTINDLPAELNSVVDQTAYSTPLSNLIQRVTRGSASGSTSTPAPQTDQQIADGQISGLKKTADKASADAAGAQGDLQTLIKGSGSAFSTLQNALRAKMGYTGSVPIGESSIFKEAGVTGFGSLSASLNARGTELDNNKESLQNIVTGLKDVYQAEGTAASTRYQNAIDLYKTTSDQMNKVLDDLRTHEQRIQELKLQNQLAINLEDYKRTHPDMKTALAIEQAGYVVDDTTGKLVMDVSGATPDDVYQAIMQKESGGQSLPAGATGEMAGSLMQFLPATWKTISAEYATANGIPQTLNFTPANEEKVAKWKIGQLMAEGYGPEEVAKIWNTSLGGVEQPLDRKGVNNGVPYDSSSYAQSVLGILRKNMGDAGKSNTVAGSIGQSIIDGLQPPVTTGLYKNAADVKAYMAKKGFNLSQASLEWDAAKKFVSSANSTQQLRLKQAATSVLSGIDNLKTLNADFQRYNFVPLNKAEIAAAANGVGPEKDAATAYMTQLSLVSDELGQVFMGGNSPTDAAFALTQKALNGNLGYDQLNTQLDTVKQNLTYRLNAIGSVGPAGTGGDNRYSTTSPSGIPVTVDTSGKIYELSDAPTAPVGAVIDLNNGKKVVKTGQDHYEDYLDQTP